MLTGLAVVMTGGLAAAQTVTNTPATNAPPVVVNTVAETNDAAEITPTNMVRMNFQGVPLNTVLTYLSARMGFVINSDVDVRGEATIVSEQPVGSNEVVQLLSAALAKNNYAVTQSGRILNITTMDTSKTAAGTPVFEANSPTNVPINDQVATYILPVHTLNPTQLIKDLEQLIPPGATVVANEAGNAIIMTARQKDIHRFAEIISALDGSSVSEVNVFVLKYADSKAVSDELKEVFQSPDSSVARSDARTRFRGGGGFGMGMFPGGGDAGANSEQKNAANKAVFTSDDQMNAVIASAPPDYFPMISNVVDRLDQPTSDITMIKVFHLKYSDATEIANELSSLFPDPDSSSSQNSRTMGNRFVPPWMQPQAPANNKSERMTRQSLVRVVPDPRTASVIVTTSKDQMEQIAGMIEALDQSDAQVQHVHAWQLSTADPITVQAALTQLFAGQNSKAPSSTQNTSALMQRQQNAAQQQTTPSTSGFGTAASGSGGSSVP
jgi:type II secretory pathway component GspD/PulD (secretin)